MVKKINIKLPNKSRIYFIGDLHLGSRTFAKKEFEQLLNMLKKDKKAYLCLQGDYCDLIESDDSRRYDPANIDKKWNNAIKQYNAVLKYFKPFKNRIIGVLRGNHEATYAKYHQDLFSEEIRDYAEQLAHDLNVNFLEDMGVINITIGKHKYNIVAAHGCGCSSQLAGQIRSLTRLINGFEISPDIAVLGHVHSLQTIINPKMNFNFQTKIKHLGLSGNFYKTYIQGNINYASSNLYNPLPIGCIMYELDKKGNIKDNKIIFD